MNTDVGPQGNAVPLTRRIELVLKWLTRRTRIDRENDRIEGDVGL